MTTTVTSPNWQGHFGQPIDPATLRFKAQPSTECNGCLFADQSITVCDKAAQIARGIGQPDCDQPAPGGRTYVYVIDKSDPRQLDMLKGGEHGR